MAEEQQFYTHPDTGDRVEIPAGSRVVRTGDMVDTPLGRVLVEVDGLPDGEILFWHNPPALAGDDRHPHFDDGYLSDVSVQPGDKKHFARDSAERWVLASITDEVDLTTLGPRNTVSSISYFLSRCPDCPAITPVSHTALGMLAPGQNVDLGDAPTAEAQVEACLESLQAAGLARSRGDGSFERTDAGHVELSN